MNLEKESEDSPACHRPRHLRHQLGRCSPLLRSPVMEQPPAVAGYALVPDDRVQTGRFERPSPGLACHSSTPGEGWFLQENDQDGDHSELHSRRLFFSSFLGRVWFCFSFVRCSLSLVFAILLLAMVCFQKKCFSVLCWTSQTLCFYFKNQAEVICFPGPGRPNIDHCCRKILDRTLKQVRSSFQLVEE